MQFTYYRNLNVTEKYVTKAIKYQLLNSDELSICYDLTRQFEYDSRYPKLHEKF